METKVASYYNEVDDPRYSLAQNQISVDRTTLSKYSVCHPASENGSGATLSDLWTQFNITKANGTAFHLRNTFLKTQLKLVAAAGGAGGQVAPSWNLIGKLFKQIEISFNNSGINMCQAGADNLALFTSRALAYLNNKTEGSNFLFQPCGDELYTGTATHAGITDRDIYTNVNTTAIVAGHTTQDCYTPLVPAGAAAGVDPKRIGKKSGRAQRYENYVSYNSNTNTYTAIIPLWMLCDAFYSDVIFNNIESIQIRILWESKANIKLERMDATEDGVVNILKCETLVEMYRLSGAQKEIALKNKTEGKAENLCFVGCECYTKDYTPGNEIILNNITNLDSICILEFAQDKTNGKAADDCMTYDSTGQFLLIGDGVAGNKCVLDKHKNSTVPIQTIQIFYGDPYPNQPIQLGTVMSSGELFCEYYKAMLGFGHCESTFLNQLDMDNTMPIIWLRPHSEAIRLTPETRDLRISMTGGGAPIAPATTSSSTVKVIPWRVMSYRIESNGSVLKK